MRQAGRELKLEAEQALHHLESLQNVKAAILVPAREQRQRHGSGVAWTGLPSRTLQQVSTLEV